MVSITRSDIISAGCRQPIEAIPKACEIPVAASSPSASGDMIFSRKRRKSRTNRILTVHDRSLLLDKTADNFKGLSGSRPTLIQGQPIQPLDCCFDVLLSPKLPHKFLCPIELPIVTNQDKLTKSPLLDLLGSKSERRDQFHNYLHQNICQSWRRRDPAINTESAEEVLEGHEKVDQCVIAGTHFSGRLGGLDVREICR